MSDRRQNNQLELAFTDESRSEAPRVSGEGIESLAAKRGTESPAIGEQWMEEVCERENCKQALSRIKANKGSAGMDGMTVQQLPEHLKQQWPAIREQLLSGTYVPQPVDQRRRGMVNLVQDKAGRESAQVATGRDPEAGRWNTKAWYSDGVGSIYPAGGDAGSAEQVGPDVFRAQPRVSSRAVGWP
jgi:RNA-directed DNA polymerase